ncbi:unnamed protein product [Danaus chrysippus]|uniref:(African queen) hypothetical protein n=1 Tax=Danaus chrysippus TaxID=151541 RepID=A0A8J2VWI3_9NEOP|nr:unnamed protein product [Danaus chrysippus]
MVTSVPEELSPEEPCKEESVNTLENSSSDEYLSDDNDDPAYIPERSVETPVCNINLRPRRAVQYAEKDDHDQVFYTQEASLVGVVREVHTDYKEIPHLFEIRPQFTS